MEKKKLLLVAISVGVFLIVVIGAALLAFSPGNRASKTVVSRQIPVREPVYPGTGASGEEPLTAVTPDQPSLFDAVDTIKNVNGIQGIQPLPVNPGSSGDNSFYIINSAGGDTGAKGQSPVNRQSPVQGQSPANRQSSANGQNPAQGQNSDKEQNPANGPQVVITVPQPVTVSAPAASATPAVSAAKPLVQPVSPAASSPSGPAAPAARAVEKNPPAPVTATPVSAVSPSRVYDTYWIQTGSFSIKTRAEGVQEQLASRGIAAIIENRDIDGKTFFRVRIGPYTSKNEADYWLSLVKSIEGFEESLVWQNKSRL